MKENLSQSADLSIFCHYCLKEKNIHEYLLHPVSSYLRKKHRCAECYLENSIKAIKKCCACNNLKLTSEFPSLRCYRCKDCKF